jgi:hypothetical protein
MYAPPSTPARPDVIHLHDNLAGEPGTLQHVKHEVLRASSRVKMRIFRSEAASLENDVVLEAYRLGGSFGNHVKLTLS